MLDILLSYLVECLKIRDQWFQ